MINKNKLNNQIVSSMIWRLFERGGVQVVQFIVQLVLARLLVPDDYGLLAIINVFISFSSTIINNGLGNAIVQKKNVDKKDYNTVFFFSIGIAIFLFITLFFSAPYIALYYENALISKYLRCMLVILLFKAVCSAQQTYLVKNMEFKKSFLANFLGTVVQGIIGITLAYCGFGCWSLILSQITMEMTVCITLVLSVRWKPEFVFSLSRLKELFSFSWKLTVGWLIGTLHQELYSLIIGRVYSTKTLGYYNRGQNLPSSMNKTINETFSAVMFPALSKIQDDMGAIKSYTRKMMAMSSFIVFPFMAFIASISKPFIIIFLTEKWSESIPMMQLFCISLGINSISTTNMQSFNSIGRSDIFMKLEIIKRTLSIVLLILLSRISIYVVIIGLGFMGLFSLCFNSYYNSKLIKYNILEQLSDIGIPMFLSVLVFILVVQVTNLKINLFYILIIQALLAMIVYLFLSYIFNKKTTIVFINMTKNIMNVFLNKFKINKSEQGVG